MTAPRPKYEAVNEWEGSSYAPQKCWAVYQDSEALAVRLTESEARRWAASEQTEQALREAVAFIESAREHFDDPETTRCRGCTNKLFLYDARKSRSLSEIKAKAADAIRRAELPGE